MKTCVLFNPQAGNGSAAEASHGLDALYGAENISYYDISKVNAEGFEGFFAALPEDVPVIISGGDGTLHCFANAVRDIPLRHKIYYYATGSGNDFLHDLGYRKGQAPFEITGYLRRLPVVHLDSGDRLFINGVGYGIDGYCCEEGDRRRQTKSDKPINYTLIALKGLLYAFKPANAVVTVDGVEHAYRKVWLAPTMQGRYYGGGMMVAPVQDRTNDEGTVTVVVAHDLSKLMIVTLFPSIFKGKHVRYKKYVDIFHAREVSVRFDAPCAMQIDGETVLGADGYRVTASGAVRREEKQAAPRA